MSYWNDKCIHGWPLTYYEDAEGWKQGVAWDCAICDDGYQPVKFKEGSCQSYV